jgi:hypothetical protein
MFPLYQFIRVSDVGQGGLNLFKAFLAVMFLLDMLD